MKYFVIALAASALTSAQTPVISIRPNMSPGLTGASSAMAGARMGMPVLGYVAGPGALDLHIIMGTSRAAQMGGSVAVPSGAKQLFVPPRALYVLLESKANEPLAIWTPLNASSDAVPLPAAVAAHPDNIAFSARGDAAVLYSRSGDRLQVVTDLPAEPHVSAQAGIAQWGPLKSLAVSDDGEAVSASLADGTAVVSLRGSTWQRLPAAYNARVVSFVPHTHNLVVSDTAQQTLLLIGNVALPTQTTRIVAYNVAADRLAFTKEGGVLLAASSSQNKVWTLDLSTMTLGPVSSASSIDTLLPLRDGHTFLLSATGVALLKVPVENDNAAGFVAVTY